MAVSGFVVELVVFCWAGEIFTPLWAQGWPERVVGVKLGQLPGPHGCEHHILPDAGLAAASLLCQALFQADSCSQDFPPVTLPLAFFGATLLFPGSRAVCSPPQQIPAASHGCCGPRIGRIASNYFCFDFFFLLNFCLYLRKTVHKYSSEIFT